MPFWGDRGIGGGFLLEHLDILLDRFILRALLAALVTCLMLKAIQRPLVKGSIGDTLSARWVMEWEDVCVCEGRGEVLIEICLILD